MTHLSRVLVAIDFSKPAQDAFACALALSRRHEAELIAVQAVPTHETFARHGRARLTLAEKLRAAANAAGISFSVRVQTGDPADIILLHARSLRPDLIVAGTHQRRGVARFRAGSVAERVAAKATVPVLLVPRRRDPRAMRPFRHVAVAVDFSAGSRRAIAHALRLASRPGDRITLIHALPGWSSQVPLHLYGYGLDERHDPSVTAVEQRLRAAVPADRHSDATIDVRVVRGHAATAISRIVGSIGADVVLVGVTARGFASRALFGSTAARLLAVTPVPMLAVADAAFASEAAASTTRHLAA